MQRRLGMLACASDLSEKFKEELRGIRSALEQKRACNTAVDGVVSQEVTPLSHLACTVGHCSSRAASLYFQTTPLPKQRRQTARTLIFHKAGNFFSPLQLYCPPDLSFPVRSMLVRLLLSHSQHMTVPPCFPGGNAEVPFVLL